jgi:hypothetical protein
VRLVLSVKANPKLLDMAIFISSISLTVSDPRGFVPVNRPFEIDFIWKQSATLFLVNPFVADLIIGTCQDCTDKPGVRNWYDNL